MYENWRYQVVVDQAEIHRMARSGDVEERREAAYELYSNFTVLLDKKQVWEDLHRLTYDGEDVVRLDAGYALVGIFTIVPDKEQAWKDLIRLTQDGEINVGWGAADPLGSVFAYVHDKKQAQDDLHRLIQDDENFGRLDVANALGGAFAYVPDKNQAWNDLQRLTQDEDSDVRTFANYSLGKASIFKATEVENKEDFKKELEKAIRFFEKSNEEVFFFEPARFCLPLYRSFYTITFKKEEAEAEIQKYLSEAKSAVQGSESKEKLLEAVENMGNALKEAQKARDFSDVKADLNAYRRYCDRACELLETTEEKAPGASRLIKRGLPIIDEKIKGIIAEIREKAKALCKQVKDTEYKEIGQQVNNVGQELSKVIDPIRLEKEVSHMLIPLSAMCKKMPEEDRGEACEILKQINDEQNVEDKLPLISMFLTKISTQMSKEPIIGSIHIENSEGVQVIVGTGNKQVQDSNSSLK